METFETAYNDWGDLQLFTNNTPSFFPDALFGLETWGDLVLLPQLKAEYAGESSGFESSAIQALFLPENGSHNLNSCGPMLKQEP